MLIWRDSPNRLQKVCLPGFIADLLETCNVFTKHQILTPMHDIARPPGSEITALLTAIQQVESQAKVDSYLWVTNST